MRGWGTKFCSLIHLPKKIKDLVFLNASCVSLSFMVFFFFELADELLNCQSYLKSLCDRCFPSLSLVTGDKRYKFTGIRGALALFITFWRIALLWIIEVPLVPYKRRELAALH